MEEARDRFNRRRAYYFVLKETNKIRYEFPLCNFAAYIDMVNLHIKNRMINIVKNNLAMFVFKIIPM